MQELIENLTQASPLKNELPFHKTHRMTADVSIDFQRLADSFERQKKRSLLLRQEPVSERNRRQNLMFQSCIRY